MVRAFHRSHISDISFVRGSMLVTPDFCHQKSTSIEIMFLDVEYKVERECLHYSIPWDKEVSSNSDLVHFKAI